MVAAKKAGLQFVRTAGGISEYRLPHNGLQVLHKFNNAAPVVAVCVTYHVGSRNEASGHTGSTHILEHLLFKDSKKFNRKNGKAMTDYLEWFGANMNATTWFDRTNYYELLPKEHAGKALEMEADRMRNSLFSDADLASEMPVVRNEYERSRNNPFELLDEEMMAKAFTVHPYRIPTIGSKEDIEGSNEKKLREFYNTYYWPNNATLIIFGDISWNATEKLVLKYFGNISASPDPIPSMTAVEPPQKESRMVRLRKALGIEIASVSYKIPAGRHPDYPAILLLGTILAGGFSNRLQQSLVDRGLAASVGVSVPALHDPGIMTFTAHVAHNATPTKVLTAMQSDIRAVAQKAVTNEEVARARERLLSQFAFERDGILGEMWMVSESIAAGDWRLGLTIEAAIKKITVADCLRVAKKYFLTTGKTTGILEQS